VLIIHKMNKSKGTPTKQPKSTYQLMVSDALESLNERNGSSFVAIAKFIEAKYVVVDTFRQRLKTSLKKGAEEGTYVKVKQSYKLNASGKSRTSPTKKITTRKNSRKLKRPNSEPIGSASNDNNNNTDVGHQQTNTKNEETTITTTTTTTKDESDEEYRRRVNARVKRKLFDD